MAVDALAGVVDDPDGVAMRQVPHSKLLWGYHTWVSEGGAVRNRFFDPYDRSWLWGDVRRPRVDARGRVGYTVYGAFRTVEQVIALAWVARRRPMLRMRALRDAEGDDARAAPMAHRMSWADEGGGGSDEASDDDDEDDDEDFRPLCLKVGIVPCVRDDVLISRRGRIRLLRHEGVVLRGHASYGPSYLYPIENVGLLPLDLVGHMVCTGTRLRTERPAPRVARTLKLLREGRGIAQIALELSVRENTAWSYAHVAMRHVSTDTARELTLRLASERLHAIVSRLASETRFVLGGRLRDVVALVNHVVVDDADWRSSPSRYARIGLVRALLQRY